jgi:peptidoglycan/xylan/chitin deacetylase (PgdA/CDA1 family)
MVRSIPILVYHQVVNGEPQEVHAVSSTRFAEQMRWLSDHGYRTLRLDAGSPDRKTEPEARSKKAIAITFDDGYQDNHANALPVLETLGLTAVFFLVAERVGATNDWDRGGGSSGGPLMGWAEISGLVQAGHQLGSHTCTHPILTDLDQAGAEREIRRSREIIEAETQTQVHVLSYPYSRYNPAHQRIAAASGYRLACTYLTDYCGRAGTEPFALRRMAVLAHDTLDDFAGKVQGTLKWRIRWYRRLARTYLSA